MHRQSCHFIVTALKKSGHMSLQQQKANKKMNKIIGRMTPNCTGAVGVGLITQKAREDRLGAPVEPTSLDQFAPKTAGAFMEKAALTLVARGREYDGVGGERSGGRIAAAFNAITGRDLSPAEVYLLLLVLKQVRQFNGKYHQDSGVDGVAYAALVAEARASET